MSLAIPWNGGLLNIVIPKNCGLFLSPLGVFVARKPGCPLQARAFALGPFGTGRQVGHLHGHRSPLIKGVPLGRVPWLILPGRARFRSL